MQCFRDPPERGEILLGQIFGSVHQATPASVQQRNYLCCYFILLATCHQKFSSFGAVGQRAKFFEFGHVRGAKRDKKALNCLRECLIK